jgi:hypothetical protein
MTYRLTNSPLHRNKTWFNLGDAVPQTPWDLARFCHPMWGLKNQTQPGTSAACPRHGLAPEVGAQVASLRCLTLRSDPPQCKPGDPAEENEILRFQKKIAENVGS